MTIKAKIAHLDDYSGELARILARLEMEHANGTGDKTQQLDFLADLRQATYKRDLWPWRARSIRGAVAGVVLLILATGLLLLFPDYDTYGEMAYVLAIIFLGVAGWSFIIYVKRQRAGMAWFQSLETTIQEGASLFDLL